MMPRPRYRRLPPAERRRRLAARLPYAGMLLALLAGISLALLVGKPVESALPGLLAWIFGAALCLWSLPPAVGWPRARRASAACLLTLPPLVDATLFGESRSALLSLICLAAALALARGWRFLSAGRFRLPLALAALALLGAFAAFRPAAIPGFPVRAPRRALSAANGWRLLDTHDRRRVRDTRPALANPALRPVTFRRTGEALAFGYLLFLLALIWKRPTRYILFLAAAMAAFALFLLPTRAESRDLFPAVALLAALAPLAPFPRRLFIGLCATATLSLFPLPEWFAALLSLANVGLFLWGTAALWRASRAPALFDNPFDWLDIPRADALIESATRAEQ